MTFKEIQKNHPVYLFNKAEVEVKQGKVLDNQPHLNTGIATISGSGQPMRDVTIDVDGKQSIYTIPEQLSVSYAGDLVLSTDKSSIAPEVERVVNDANDIINSFDAAKARKEKGEQLLADLNPAVKEKRFKSIEGDISGIKGMVRQLLDKLG